LVIPGRNFPEKEKEELEELEGIGRRRQYGMVKAEPSTLLRKNAEN